MALGCLWGLGFARFGVGGVLGFLSLGIVVFI